MATEAVLKSTAHRSGPSSRPTGSPLMSSVMPGRTMTPFRSPLTHTVRVAESRSSSMPWSTHSQREQGTGAAREARGRQPHHDVALPDPLRLPLPLAEAAGVVEAAAAR